MEIPSGPRAVFGPIDRIISSLQISKDENLYVVTKHTLRARVLSLSVVLHFSLKHLLNKIAFIKRLITSWLFTKKVVLAESFSHQPTTLNGIIKF